jgi:hypothetical protein
LLLLWTEWNGANRTGMWIDASRPRVDLMRDNFI